MLPGHGVPDAPDAGAAGERERADLALGGGRGRHRAVLELQRQRKLVAGGPELRGEEDTGNVTITRTKARGRKCGENRLFLSGFV